MKKVWRLSLAGMIPLGLAITTTITVTPQRVSAASILRQAAPAFHEPHSKSYGPVPNSLAIPLDIILKPQNQNKLLRLDRAISNPKSSQFRHFLTTQQLAGRFGPSKRAISFLRLFFKSHGFSVTRLSKNHLIMRVVGPASAIDSTFDTELTYFSTAHGLGRFYGNITPAYIPSSIKPYVSAILGLNSAPISPAVSTQSAKLLSSFAPSSTTEAGTLVVQPLETSVPVGQQWVVNITAENFLGLPVAGVTIVQASWSGPTQGQVVGPQPTGPDVLGGTGVDSVTNSNGQAQVYLRFTVPGTYSVQLIGTDSSGEFISAPIAVTATGSSPLLSEGYTPVQINTAYDATNVVSSSGGAGVTVCVIAAEVDTTGSWASDLSTYFSGMGLDPPAPQVIDVSDGSTWQYSNSWLEEAESDVERVNSAAPNAQVIVYDAPTSDPTDLFYAVNTAIENGQCQIVTMSWSGISSPTGLFATGVAEGTTFFAASGDTGAYTQGQVSPGYPADSPNVTGVGGTQMAIASTGQISSEAAWSPQFNWDSSGYPAASGGGYASGISEPSWQSAVQDTGARGTPDVALMAGYGWYDSFINGNWQFYGGTSESSPTWAGYLADIEGADDLTGWGNINPVLYALATSNSSPLTPIQFGSSLWSTPWTTDVGYSANGIWSPVTGLGTPNVDALATQMGELYPTALELSASTAAPGQTVTVSGNNFGPSRGSGYVQFQDAGVSWGAPGNAAPFQVDSWSNTQITFTVPTPSGPNDAWAVVPGTTATITVVTSEGGATSPETLTISGPQITQVTPSPAYAGEQVTVTGAGFGASQGTSYLQLQDNGVSWGAPGNAAPFQVDSWSNTQITFTVPTPSGPNDAWAVVPGTTATITVVTGDQDRSLPTTLGIEVPQPIITSMTPTPAEAGQTVTIIGTNFGSTQGSGYVAFQDDGTNWGAPGNAAAFQIDQWSNTQITFTVPLPSGPNDQWAIVPGSTATITVVTSQAASTEATPLSLLGSPAITSLSPTSGAPGTIVTITGNNFGVPLASSYVQFQDAGVSWGAPGNAAPFQVDSWSNTQITFTVPTPSGPNDAWAVVPGTTATITVVTGEVDRSGPVSLVIISP
jgi:hypothetical protein